MKDVSKYVDKQVKKMIHVKSRSLLVSLPPAYATPANVPV